MTSLLSTRFHEAIANRAATIAVAAALSCPAISAAAQFSFEKIALTRDPAPGTGVVFDRLFAPELNENGQVWFNSRLTGSGIDFDNQNTIHTGFSENDLALVLREQGGLPQFEPGATSDFFGLPRANSSGQMVTAGVIAGPGIDESNNRLVYLHQGGVTTPASRAGDAVLGLGDGVVFDGGQNAFGFDWVNFNDAGQLAFSATFTGAGVDFDNDRGIMAGPLGAPAVVAREGDLAPGAGPDVRFGSFFQSRLLMDESGGVSFFSPLTGPNITSDNSQSLWSNTSGELGIVARRDGVAPAAGFGAVYRRIFEHDLSDTGESLFTAELAGMGIDDSNDSGIFRHRDGVTEVVARQGEPAPGLGPGVELGGLASGVFEFPSIAINGSGKALFRMQLQGIGVDDSNDAAAYMTDENGDLQLIFREGDQVPGLDDGIVFTDTELGGGVTLNERGDVLIRALLEGPGVEESNDFAMFFLDGEAGGELQMVIRQGDVIDVNNSPLVEDLRTVASFESATQANRNSFNDSRQIGMQVVFTDTSEGVFLTTLVPEPSTAVLAVLPIATLVRRRR